MFLLLLQALLLLKAVAVCKCLGHTGRADSVSRGNAHPDTAAKTAADKGPLHTQMALLPSSPPPTSSLFALQSFDTFHKKTQWKNAGCVFCDDVGRDRKSVV